MLNFVYFLIWLQFTNVSDHIWLYTLFDLQYNKLRAEALFAEASNILSVTEGILTGTTLTNYNRAFQMFNDIVRIINGINPAITNLNNLANTTVDLTGTL